jgi:hypothetical protein
MTSEHGNHHEQHHFPDNPEGRSQWFFKEFWVVLLFGGCFLTMMVLPLVLFGGMLQLQLSALVLAVAAIGTIAITVLLPRFLPLWLLLYAVAMFMMGSFSNDIFVKGFLTLMVLVGAVILPLRKRP